MALKTEFIGLWIIGNVLSSIEALYRKGSLSLVNCVTIGAIPFGYRFMQKPAVIYISSNILMTLKAVTNQAGSLHFEEGR